MNDEVRAVCNSSFITPHSSFSSLWRRLRLSRKMPAPLTPSVLRFHPMNAKRLVTRLALSLSLLLTSFPPSVQAQAAAPRAENAVVRLPGLKKTVKVRRDERGIAYVEAEDELDLYFAQGYVTASDRLWQMDLFRRTARGELSEIFGKAALEEDKRRRNYGFAQVAEASAAQADSRSRAVMEAYSAGVNAYIDSLDDKSLPPEFQLLGYRPRHWTPADSAAVGKNFAEALSTTWTLDIARAVFANLPPDKAAALFPEASPLDVLVVGSDKTDRKTSTPAKRISALPSLTNTTELLAELSLIQKTEEHTRA